jgi:hypothetical protein
LGNVVQESILATKYTYGIFTTGLIGKKRGGGGGFKKRNLDTAFHCQQLRCYFLPVLRDIIIALSNNDNNNGGNTTTATNSTSKTEADFINNAQMPRKKISTWWGKI